MRALSILLVALACLVSGNSHAATTLLPNGKQCFTDATGAIISGSVNMFVVGTTTPKPTWQDSNQNTLNSQPIQLDGNGCAVIYGIGAYRQQVFDGPVVGGVTTGNLIFDQVTTDTSAYNAVFWAGISGGTPNVITVVDPGFNSTDGTVINFTALATNTGAATLNPSGVGAFNIVKDTAAGPVALTGGEIVQNNIISVVFSASGNNFHLLNTAIATAAGNTAPLCGATNLKIVNSVATPSTIITITADTAVMVSAAGVVINRANVNQNINISTGTVTAAAGGMDGEAPGTSAWLDLFLIDNGSAPAGLASLAAGNAKSPNMPSGYTFKCYLGAMRVDGSGNLFRTMQKGIFTQYTLVTPSNTQNYPAIGNTGSATLASLSITGVVPPTASAISIIGVNTGISLFTIAPNNIGSATLSTTGPSACSSDNPGAGNSIMCSFMLESTNVFASTNAGTVFLLGFGWRDQVNAN